MRGGDGATLRPDGRRRLLPRRAGCWWSPARGGGQDHGVRRAGPDGGGRRALGALVVELEGKSGIGAAFGRPEALGYEETVLSGPAPGRAGSARAGRAHPRRRPARVPGRPRPAAGLQALVTSGVVDVVATAIPGIRDVLVLGKIKQLERAGVADLIVVDAPATGHADDLPHLGQRAARRGPGRPGPGPGGRRGRAADATRPAAGSSWSPCPRRCR